jgi:hypothetical protein
MRWSNDAEWLMIEPLVAAVGRGAMMPDLLNIIDLEQVFQTRGFGQFFFSFGELRQSPLSECTLGFLDLKHTFLYAVLHHHSIDTNRTFLTNTMDPVGTRLEMCLVSDERCRKTKVSFKAKKRRYKNPLDNISPVNRL